MVESAGTSIESKAKSYGSGCSRGSCCLPICWGWQLGVLVHGRKEGKMGDSHNTMSSLTTSLGCGAKHMTVHLKCVVQIIMLCYN